MISVCMAVCNGSNFIGEQIASIVPQLGPEDEIIVVDDASRDNSIAILDGFHDVRITIIRQEQNRGIVRSFERALQGARGDIIFLSDQDDIWRGDKVDQFMRIFETRPDVTVVMSDLLVVDGSGKVISGSKFSEEKFHGGLMHNLLRNRYQGSAMAFRRSILKYCLPFPADIPIHDVWIGLVNRFLGKTEFIGEPLLLYRRHGRNESPAGHASLMKMVGWRWALVKNLIRLYATRLAFRKDELGDPA